MKKCEHLKAVVFDWAGTTIDFGSRGPVIVFREVFKKRGIAITEAQAREPMGLAKRDHIAAIANMPDIAKQWQSTHQRGVEESDIDQMYAEFLPLQKSVLSEHSDVIADVADTVEQCRTLGLKIGSTTGYTRELMDVVVPIANQQGYNPDCVVCAGETSRGRPSPFPLYEAAMRLDVYPMNSIIKVDDTTAGIEAGLNAGCWTVGVFGTGNTLGLSEEELNALDEGEQNRLLQESRSVLNEAGAHYTIHSASQILSVIELVESQLTEGRSA